MSPLTKVLVVFVAFLSVLLVALVVPFVAQTQDYKALNNQLKSEKESALAKAASAEQQISAAQDRISEQITSLNNQVQQLTQQQSQLRTERDNAVAEKLQLEREVAKRDAELSRFSAAAEQDANLLTVTSTDLKQTREALVDAQTKLVQLGDRNNELESQRDSLNRQVSRLGEKMVSLEQDNIELRGVLAKVPDQYRQAISTGEITPPIVSGPPIAGTVTDVQSAAGTQLVQINVGAKDEVKENMKFLVHRGDVYVGTLVVDRVEDAASAGRMTLVKGDVRSGDQVYSGPY